MRLLLDPAVNPTPAAAAPVAATPVSTSATSSVPASPAASTPAALPPAASAPAKPAEPAKAPWLAAPDPAAAAAKPAEPAAAAAKPDEKFNLKVPDGFKLEAAGLDAFEAQMRALGVNADQAQKLLTRDLEAQKAADEAVLAQITKQDADWEKELRSHFGEKYPEMGEKLKRVYDYIDPQGELRKGLEAMRMAHNPVLNKALAKLIPLFEEPKLKPPSSTGVVEKDNRTPQEKLAAQFRDQLAKTPVIPGGMKFTT